MTIRQIFKLIVLLPLLGLFLSCGVISFEKQPELIEWRTLAQGKVEAAEKKMPCLIDFFYGEGCHRCVMMVEELYEDQAIAERINKNFIPVRVDLTRALTKEEMEVADALESGNECILLFMDHTGNIVKNSKGKAICSMDMLSKDEFVVYLDNALKSLATPGES